MKKEELYNIINVSKVCMLSIFVNHLIGMCYYTKIMNFLSNFLNLLIVFLELVFM
jgi:hypothetical protein